MRTSLLLVAFASCTPLLAQTYKLPAIDSVSISRVSPNVFQDNRLRAYNYPTATYQDVVGLFLFDLSVIPDSSTIQSMTLTLWMENQFGSPANNPIVDLHRSADDAWTRATATATSGALGPVVCAAQSGFVHPKHAFSINLAAHNFAQDLADDRLTLVIDNVNPVYSYVYFFGHTGTPAGQNAELEIVVTPNCGTLSSFGLGGKDGTGARMAMLGSGCAARGMLMYAGAKLGVGNAAPIFLFCGASNTLWGATPLPYDLSAINMPGNKLYVSLDVMLGVVPNVGGSGQLPLPIPNNAALANVSLHFQCAAIDPLATPLGVVASNGVTATIQ